MTYTGMYDISLILTEFVMGMKCFKRGLDPVFNTHPYMHIFVLLNNEGDMFWSPFFKNVHLIYD